LSDLGGSFTTTEDPEEPGPQPSAAIRLQVAEGHDCRIDVAESEEGGARFEIAGVEFASQYTGAIYRLNQGQFRETKQVPVLTTCSIFSMPHLSYCADSKSRIPYDKSRTAGLLHEKRHVDGESIPYME
jgi:hypothetical protein